MSILEQLLQRANLRLDAKYTAFLEQALEAVKARTYDVKYPGFKARSLIPLASGTPSGAETISYQQWDEVGMAKIIANYADDLPQVDALAEKFSTPVVSMGDAYSYSIQDLRRAAMAGVPLDAKKAMAARRAIERKIDELAGSGDAKSKLRGLTNHPNVTIYAAATDGTSARWVQGRATPKTPLLILRDLHNVINGIRNTTKELHTPDTVVLPTYEFGHLEMTQVSADNDTNILQAFLKNAVSIRGVESWYKLDTADAAGTGPRALVYERNAEVLELEVPQEFEQFPPQAQNLAFLVPCHARCGGVIVRYPLAIGYLDGI